jgi:hypothetical protein
MPKQCGCFVKILLRNLTGSQKSMRIAKTLLGGWTLFSAVAIAGWFCGSPTLVNAQGDTAVYNSSSTVTGSSAYIDASVFSGDICAQIHTALGNLPSTGGLIDARGIIPKGSQPCATNPFLNVTVPSTVLLPPTFITIETTWTLPGGTKISGEGPLATVLQACSTTSCTSNFSGSVMISMCSSACTGVSIEHLQLDARNGVTNNQNTTWIDAIDNANAQDFSYVDDVILSNVGLIGLNISAPNSGPYTKINYLAASCNGTQCPACVKIQAQTRGLHGITCIGDKSVSSNCNGGNCSGFAGIFVNASNNSIEDVHLEGFWDGIEIGNTGSGSTVGNTVVSNVTSGVSGAGPVINTVHICGNNPPPSTHFGECLTPGTVSDVTILAASDISPGVNNNTTSIQDDVTGTSITPPNTSSESFVALYALGEEVGGSTTKQYSRFATSPSASSGTSAPYSTAVPTWSVGSGLPPSSCVTPGALYSNKTGAAPPASPTAVYVCTTGTTGLTWQPIV